MTLLLQCLRAVRARSSDLDLLPPSAGGNSLGADRLLRNDDESGVASPRFHFDEARPLLSSNADLMTREIDRHCAPQCPKSSCTP